MTSAFSWFCSPDSDPNQELLPQTGIIRNRWYWVAPGELRLPGCGSPVSRVRPGIGGSEGARGSLCAAGQVLFTEL